MYVKGKKGVYSAEFLAVGLVIPGSNGPGKPEDHTMTREFKITLTFKDGGPADILYIWAETSTDAADCAIAKYHADNIYGVCCRATGIKA